MRAEDVMLEKKVANLSQSSARNHLLGHIRSVDRKGAMMRQP